MDIDTLLDFIVDNYIWFIIGAAILVLAIIGFIADKNKFFSKTKNNKVKKEENKLEENKEEIQKEVEKEIEKDDFWSDSTSKKESKKLSDSQMIINSQDIDKLNEEMENDQKKIVDNLSENFDANTISMAEKENNELHINNDTQDSEQNGVMGNEEKNYEESINEDTNIDHGTNIDDDLNQENIFEVVHDINTINNIEFSEQDSPNIDNGNSLEEEPISTEEKMKKNLNDDLEDTMQISYSQLREMVEDIIAENQMENSLKNENEEQETNESQSIQDVDLSDENSNLISDLSTISDNETDNSINGQEEDEDDVWKF